MPTQGKDFWKFINSLTSNDDYVEKMKNKISETVRTLDQDKITDKHLRWEFSKYEITSSMYKWGFWATFFPIF